MFQMKCYGNWESRSPGSSGKNRITGAQIIIEPASIIGIKGQGIGRIPENGSGLRKSSRKMLFLRDRHLCAYCGAEHNRQVFVKGSHTAIIKRGEGYLDECSDLVQTLQSKKG